MSIPRGRILVALAVALAIPVLLAILYLLPPGEVSIYPRCIFNMLTGLHCPGCGATRATHALLHGDVRQAAAYNLFFLIALPFLIVYCCMRGFGWLTARPGKPSRQPRWLGYVLVGLIGAFWIARNLPFEPFTWLAPHRL
jgi:hypothetical protein